MLGMGLIFIVSWALFLVVLVLLFKVLHHLRLVKRQVKAKEAFFKGLK